MFGSSNSAPFGTDTGFGTATSSSLFGGSNNNGTELFGSVQQSSPVIQGLLGASGTADKGTPVKFSADYGNHTIVKKGITTSIIVRHQYITAMPVYNKKSIEELRIEDYEAGRKTELFSVCTNSGSLFENTSDSASSSLTVLQPASGFKTPGSLSGSISSTPGRFINFGQPPNTGGLFGSSASSATTSGQTELRIEDYEAGRKTELFSVCTNSGSLFENTSDSASSSLTVLQPASGFKTPGGSGFTFGSPAPTITPVAPGGFSLASTTTNTTSSPFTEAFTLSETSASTGTSNTGFSGGLTEPTGLSTFVTPNTQASGLAFGSASLQGFTLEANKTTASSTVDPKPAFTPGDPTTAASSASSAHTLTSDSVGGSPTSGLTLGATVVTTTTSGLSLGSGFKLGGTAATPAGTGFTLSVPAASSATRIIGSLSGLAPTPAATASGITASTGFPLGTPGTSTAPGFSFAAVSGLKLGSTQTMSLSTATTTGSLSGNISSTPGLFKFRQQPNTGFLFGSSSSSSTTGIRFGSGFKTASTSGQTDDPPSLSPGFALSAAMSEGMEELRKENESLRKVIKMYKENVKAMEELRKFYSAQAIKHKENMEQAVSLKFLELMSKIRGLETVRDTTLGDEKTSVVIREAIDLTRNNRIDLESLKSLHQVQECESNLQQAQECLRQCKDKVELLGAADIVSQRDKARKELFNSIELFCQEVNLIPLQEREKSLQHALNQLQEEEDTFDSSNTDPDLEVAVEDYEEWLGIRQEVTNAKQRVAQHTEELSTALSRLQLALKVCQGSSERVNIHAPLGDLDAMISSLSSAIQEEMEWSQESEETGEAKQIVDCAIKALVIELKREMEDIQELRDNLVPKYKSLQTDMSPWLEAKPDLKNVEDVRTTIESLHLRLRQKLAEKKDLTESPLDKTEELQKVESDISEIYLQLHKGFEDESTFLAELAKSSSEHFPEIPIAHPELGISEYLASNGLLKPGRELEHYPHYDSVPSVSHDKCSVIRTEFAGRPCILKELSVNREFEGIETLQNKAVNYHNVDSPFLMPLDAFFVKGNRAFVQMPVLMSAEEWLESHECSSEAIALVLRDILDALNSLHSKNICHGSVHLQSVFVDNRSGGYRGVLDFFPFTNLQCSQAKDMKLFGDLIVKMNFPNKESTTTFSQLTEDSDLLALLGDLLDTDDVDRLSAQQTLQQAYFCKWV